MGEDSRSFGRVRPYNGGLAKLILCASQDATFSAVAAEAATARAGRIGAASLRRIRGRPVGAAARHGRRSRPAEHRGRAGFEAEVLAVGPPVERLIAELDAGVARGPEVVDRGIEERGIRGALEKVIDSVRGVGGVRDGDVENPVRGADGNAGRRGGRGDRAVGIDAGARAERVDGADDLLERLVQARIDLSGAFDFGDLQHGKYERFSTYADRK